jgi:hypothetical protein
MRVELQQETKTELHFPTPPTPSSLRPFSSLPYPSNSRS